MTKLVLNEHIHARDVRLIDQCGEQLGVVPTQEALRRARAADLDLVVIADHGLTAPPVCKILDAGKWLYEKKKHEKETAKRQRAHAIETKEVQLRPNISENDLDIKARKAREFLAGGDKVKVIVKFKGREMAHKELGREVITAFLNIVGDHKIERPVTDGGNTLSLLVAPIKTKFELVRATVPF